MLPPPFAARRACASVRRRMVRAIACARRRFPISPAAAGPGARGRRDPGGKSEAMNTHDIPLLTSRQALEAARPAGQGPVVGLWATTLVNDNTALMLFLREALEQRGIRTVFFLTCKEHLPRHVRLLPPARRAGMYRVENPHVFAESSFPELLIANTLTLTAKPADFRGKTMILPHAPAEKMPNRLSYWADYLVIPTREVAPFDYSAFPNFCKHCAGRTLTLLPAGYLKNDLLCAAARRMGAGPYGRVSFFPHWKLPRGMGAEALGKLWIALIERFFSAFPGWEFVLRPLESQRAAPQVRAVREHFRNVPSRLLVECGDDGMDSLLRTDVLLTDYSSIWRNHSFTTLRPAVLFQPDAENADPPRRGDYSWTASTPEAAVAAMRQVLNDDGGQRQAIRALRDKESLHFGQAVPYLCDAVERILRGEPPAGDAIVIDKGDSPYTACRDWLRLLRRPFSQWHPENVPAVQQWHDALRGADPRVCLAILRAGLRSWADYTRPITRDAMIFRLQHALACMPAGWGIAFLRHACRVNPQDPLAAVWAAHALQRCQGDHPDAAAELRAGVRHCVEIGAPSSPLMLGVLNFSDLLPDGRLPEASAPPLLHAVTAIMRLQRGNVEQGAAILHDVSRRIASGQGTALAAAAVQLGQSLLRHADKRRPHAGRYRALHLPVMGIWLSFSGSDEARALLADALPAFQELARHDARLLMPCVHLAAATGDDDVRRRVFAVAREQGVGMRDLIVMDDILRAVAQNGDAPPAFQRQA